MIAAILLVLVQTVALSTPSHDPVRAKRFGTPFGCWSPGSQGEVLHWGEGVPLAGSTTTMVAAPLPPGTRVAWVAGVRSRVPCLDVGIGQLYNVLPVTWYAGTAGSPRLVGANGRAEFAFPIPAFMAGGGWTVFSQVWAWDGVDGNVIASTKGLAFRVP